ncbi:MAG TPA: lipoprotein-releasing ABC transporter permease subunit [Vicinamibacterales bacterium]|nr:lipoprotein-releasing ABC transporter permease subunit [Vicinamibacterales bacterium]
MNLPFEAHIALRYLLAKRKQALISVISLISTLGVMVGVMAVIIALAIMTGLQQELRERIIGSNPHIYVWKRSGITDYHAEVAKMRALPHVIGASAAVTGMALIQAATVQEFISLKGIDPALEPTVTDLKGAMKQGTLDALTRPPGEDGHPGILLGKDLANALHVGVGDSVTLFTTEGTLSPMGLVPHRRPARVAGIFELGLYEFDMTFGFISLETAERLLNKDQVEMIQIKVDDIYQAPAIARSITSTLGEDYYSQDWTAANKPLFSALLLEKLAVSLAVGLIVMVAALNIVATLILLVMDKSRDIAILKTMGARARSVTAIFILQGVIIGLVGTSAGAIIGVTVSRVLDRYQLIRVPVDVYQVSYLPFTILPLDFVMVVLTAVLICFVATIYPSRRAARLDPAQALRYE